MNVEGINTKQNLGIEEIELFHFNKAEILFQNLISPSDKM